VAEREKSPAEIAAYNAGIELARRRKEAAEAKEQEAKEPPVVYLLPTTSYTNTKASLN
jgi:hypothetical protein